MVNSLNIDNHLITFHIGFTGCQLIHIPQDFLGSKHFMTTSKGFDLRKYPV